MAGYGIHSRKESSVKIIFLTRFGVQGASSRMRIVQYLPGFESTAIESVVSPLFDDAMLLQKYQFFKYCCSLLGMQNFVYLI